MKKTLLAFFLVAVLTALSFSLAMAKTGNANLYQEDGSTLAYWVKPVDKEGGKVGSAYCSEEKDKTHPAALLLATIYADQISDDPETPEEVLVQIIMDNFCTDGFSFGQIALALHTEKVINQNDDFDDIDYVTLLDDRANGEGWGQIWKEWGKGKPKDGTPPGHFKHPDKHKDDEAEDQNTELDQSEEEKVKVKDKTPPGQAKDKDTTPLDQVEDKDKTPPGQTKDKDKDK